jgi:hypothetical protein
MNNDEFGIWGNYKRQASTDAFLEERRIARREAFDRDCDREVRETICMEDTPLPESVSANVNTRKHSHYFRDVSKLTMIDVYRVCDLFGVDDPSGATQHAIKKLLLPGKRGAKDAEKDLREAIDTLNRKLQMIREERGL